jgi:hypothetical protein
MENGRMIKWKDKELLNIKMEILIKEILVMGLDRVMGK